MAIPLLGVLCVPAQRIQNFVGGHTEDTLRETRSNCPLPYFRMGICFHRHFRKLSNSPVVALRGTESDGIDSAHRRKGFYSWGTRDSALRRSRELSRFPCLSSRDYS